MMKAIDKLIYAYESWRIEVNLQKLLREKRQCQLGRYVSKLVLLVQSAKKRAQRIGLDNEVKDLDGTINIIDYYRTYID